ncbi:MAG: TonB-dependent receptor [Bryobacteraceae bacterium]|nr:TonB-dependent receptor [Bryobacteraceae bacterium]
MTEKIAAETPAAMTVLDRDALRQAPGVNLDDRLRLVPGFSLFRRSSSLVANPTTQGVSLRGLGSTGASRTLVLWDGVPLNDPFGGWVYWTRVDPEQVERVEVSRSASTSLFGDRALGGSIGLFTEAPSRGRVRASYETGNRNTHTASARVSHLWGRLGVSAGARGFTTNGYYIVPEGLRGPIDREADVRFLAGDTRVDLLGAAQRLSLKFDLLAEERANGTVLQNNSTSLGALSGAYSHEFGTAGTLSAFGWHQRQEFRASFSAIGAGRATERLTTLQTVPADSAGGGALWQRTGSGWRTTLGADAQRSYGLSIETAQPSLVKTRAGGSLSQQGTFAQGDWGRGLVRLFGGIRHQFTGLDERFWSPSGGITAGRGPVRARFSAYRSFRAPTLNELYRDFRVGNALTQANENLRPEALRGLEAGVDFAGEHTRFSVTAYRNRLTGLITNVTVSSTPALIVRQRRNAAEAVARGFEADIRHRRGNWTGELAYLFSDSRFATRERLPQIPRHQGSGQLIYLRGGTFASAGIRSTSYQFEDDLNRFLLAGFAVAHVTVRQRLARGVSASLAVENLLDREFVVGFSPTPLIGAPVLWRAGLRWESR